MARVALLLPTSTYRAHDFVAAARSLGIEIVVASERRQAMSDEGHFVLVDFDRPDESAAAIAGLGPLDAVVAVDDAGVETAAVAARLLGLAHNPPEAVRATRHKARMRRRLADAGVPQPDFEEVGAGEDLAAAAGRLGYPVVVKAVSLAAGRGVLRADDPTGAQDAGRRIRRLLVAAGRPEGEPLLVERFVAGPELALEGLLRGGELTVLAIFDKPEPMDGPTFEETMLVTPSRLPPEVLDEVVEVARRAVTALGLAEGPVHAEFRVGDGVWLLEVAARSIGGLCGRALRFGLFGESMEALLLRHAAGLEIFQLEREHTAAGVYMLPVPRAGRLERVEGLEEAAAVAGITGIEITVPPGRRVVPLPEGDRYLGFVFARAATPAEVEQALAEAVSRIGAVIDAPPV